MLEALDPERDAMSVGEMDGFVTGLVLQEEPVTPAQWLPQVWGPRRQVGSRREAGAHAAETPSSVFERNSPLNPRVVCDSLEGELGRAPSLVFAL